MGSMIALHFTSQTEFIVPWRYDLLDKIKLFFGVLFAITSMRLN